MRFSRSGKYLPQTRISDGERERLDRFWSERQIEESTKWMRCAVGEQVLKEGGDPELAKSLKHGRALL